MSVIGATPFKSTVPGDPAARSGLRRTALIAGAIFLFDGLIASQGVLSLITLVIVFVVFLPRLYLARTDTDLFILRAKKTLFFALAAAAALLCVRFNMHLAQRRADALIAACESYQKDNQRYPERLEDLVPRFIAEIPRAKLTLGRSDYFYRAGATHTLGWTTMPPFGRRYYVLEEKRWGQSD